jgi:hypothetical protein
MLEIEVDLTYLMSLRTQVVKVAVNLELSEFLVFEES